MPNKKTNLTNLRISVVPGGVSNQRTGTASRSNKQRPKSTGSRKKRGARVMTGMDPYTRMIEDPCTSQLVPGFYGSVEGYLARFHKVYSTTPITGATCGYMLWIPEFHNQGYISATEARYNLLIGALASPSAGLDLSGYALGQEAVSDPCYSFVSGPTCGDARTISACIRLSYSGTLSNNQGMLAHLDLPYSMIEERVFSGTSLSVDDLFALSENVHRLSLDPQEQKYSPPGAEPVFKGSGGDSDGDYGIHNSGGVLQSGASAKVLNPRVIGFAWKGYSALSNSFPFFIECYKNIEWRPQTASGITTPAPTRTSTGNLSNRVVAALDAAKPGWKHSAMGIAKSAGARVTERALAYGSSAVMRRMPALAGFLM